jgi:hypothetical protein
MNTRCNRQAQSAQNAATLLLHGFQAARRGEPQDNGQPIAWREGFNLFAMQFGLPAHDLSAYPYPQSPSRST